MDDHDLLVETNTLVREMHKALNGNGKPGLIRDVVVLQEDMRKRESEATQLREDVPTKRNQTLVTSGVLTAVLVSILAAVKQVFG